MRARTMMLLGALMALSGPAIADQINTGGAQGAYHTAFCPPIAAALKDAYFNYTCTTSAGSGENLARVRENRRHVTLIQGDVWAAEAAANPELLRQLTVVRRDIASECVYAVTTNPQIRSIGDIAKAASRIPIVLPPETSGAAATFRGLQKIDPEGLGRARSNVTYAADASRALEAALASPGAVAFFVQLPDPANSNFRLIAERKGRFVPVIDRAILRYEVGGQLVYVPESGPVTAGSWTRSGEDVTTACTPMVVVTGNPEALPAGSTERKDQEDLIATLKAVDRSRLLPTSGTFDWLKKQVRSYSRETVDRLIQIAEEARR